LNTNSLGFRKRNHIFFTHQCNIFAKLRVIHLKPTETNNDNKPLSDDELVKGCLKNDVSYQELLYNRFASKMMGVSMRYCNSRMEAEDVLQDAFIKVFTRIKSFKGDGSLEGWIRKIVVFTALKSKDKRISKFEPGDVDLHDNRKFDPKAISKIQTKQLLKIIQQLPDGYRAVFNLYAIEGYSHKEIGEMLDISEVTSRTQFSRAKKHLIKLLKDYGIER
jgi:RNA polymerase sigma factor (sigma-70 family)